MWNKGARVSARKKTWFVKKCSDKKRQKGLAEKNWIKDGNKIRKRNHRADPLEKQRLPDHHVCSDFKWSEQWHQMRRNMRESILCRRQPSRLTVFGAFLTFLFINTSFPSVYPPPSPHCRFRRRVSTSFCRSLTEHFHKVTRFSDWKLKTAEGRTQLKRTPFKLNKNATRGKWALDQQQCSILLYNAISTRALSLRRCLSLFQWTSAEHL